MNKKTAPLPPMFQQPVEELFQALRHFDAEQAHLLMRYAFLKFGVEEVCLHMLIPLFRRLDKGYRTGEISLQVERFTTLIMRERLLAMFATPTQATQTGKIVIACAPHELHDTGALMFSLFMRRRGWDVIYLGQNVGFDGFDDILEQLHPKLIIFAVSHLANLRYLNEAARIIERGTHGQGVFAYAGQVFVSLPTILDHFPGIYLGDDLMSAVAKAEELMQAPWTLPEEDMSVFPPEVYTCLQYIDEQRGVLEGAAATLLTQIVDGRVETARLAQEFIDVLTVAVQFNAPEALQLLSKAENTTLLSYGMDANLLGHFVEEMERYVMSETLPKVAPVLARFIHHLAPVE